jgi:hypothetical protein
MKVGHSGRRLRAAMSAAVVVWGLGVSGTALADVVVLSSDTRSYRAGQELRDNDRLTLNDQERVTVLLPTNTVREVKGPFDGLISDLGRGRPSSGRELWTLIKGYFTTGGVTESQVGGTRSLSPLSAPETQPPKPAATRPWTSIPISKPGIYCVAAGEPVSIARLADGAVATVKLADKGMTKIAPVDFAAASDVAAWPEAVPLANEAGYRFMMPGRPPVEFTVKFLEKADIEGDEVLAALYGRGCSEQIKAWIASKNAGG